MTSVKGRLPKRKLWTLDPLNWRVQQWATRSVLQSLSFLPILLKIYHLCTTRYCKSVAICVPTFILKQVSLNRIVELPLTEDRSKTCKYDYGKDFGGYICRVPGKHLIISQLRRLIKVSDFLTVWMRQWTTKYRYHTSVPEFSCDITEDLSLIYNSQL